jgi:hypothetical protein
VHEVSTFAGSNTLDRGKSVTVHDLVCGEVWAMSRMASSQAGMGPNGNLGIACSPDVGCDGPPACRVPLARPGWQLIEFELMRGEMNRLGWAGSGCPENSHDICKAANVWVLHKTKMVIQLCLVPGS